MRALTLAGATEVVLLGAHCDDVAIGAGGTLLALCADRPDLRVRALVCTGGGTARAAEETAALRDFCAPATVELTVLDLPDGRLPTQWATVKEAMTVLAGQATSDLVFAPHRGDRHQDHRTVAEIAPTVFRDHLILGYEILKWDGDLAQPAVYQPLAEDVARRKADLLGRHYPSQHDRDWYAEEVFLSMARIRGVQQHTRYAEAFHVEKLALNLGTGSASEQAGPE